MLFNFIFGCSVVFDKFLRALQVAIDIGTLLNAKLFIVHFVPMRIVDMSMEGGVDFIKEVHQSEMEEVLLVDQNLKTHHYRQLCYYQLRYLLVKYMYLAQ